MELRLKRAYLAALFVAVALAEQNAKVDTCGFNGNVHDCHCSERTDKIRSADIATCSSLQGKKHDECVKAALNGHDHCSIAERGTDWDRDGDGVYPRAEGDSVSSPMGEYCKRACKPHRCQCTEQSCDFR